MERPSEMRSFIDKVPLSATVPRSLLLSAQPLLAVSIESDRIALRVVLKRSKSIAFSDIMHGDQPRPRFDLTLRSNLQQGRSRNT
jgi:hypothetical protein